MNSLEFLRYVGDPNSNSFFGYFNENQFSGDAALFHEVEFIDRLPESPSDMARIKVVNLLTGTSDELAGTPAWNWQQGSKARYHESAGSIYVVFNSWSVAEGLHSVWLDGGRERVLPPFYDLSQTHYCTPNYALHSRVRRGYSYSLSLTSRNRFFESEEDFLVCGLIEHPNQFEIFKAREVGDALGIDSNVPAQSYIEHLTFSPSGRYIGFLYRYRLVDGGINSVFAIYCLKSKVFFKVVDSGRFSHYCWISDEEILFYGAIQSAASSLRNGAIAHALNPRLRKLLLAIYHRLIPHNTGLSKLITGDHYYYLRALPSWDRREAIKVLPDLSMEDGHPAFNSKSGLFATDTYPDSAINKQAELYVGTFFDGRFKTIELAAAFTSLAEYDNSPLRADLHPRISECSNYLSVDSMTRGFRSVEFYKIK